MKTQHPLHFYKSYYQQLHKELQIKANCEGSMVYCIVKVLN